MDAFSPRWALPRNKATKLPPATLLALLDLHPNTPWDTASQPLRGITPIIEFVAKAYRRRFKPNTRETIRDEAVKYFVESGMVCNPDNPGRPTNSGNTVYQIEPAALSLFRAYGTLEWSIHPRLYQKARAGIRHEIARERKLARVPVRVARWRNCAAFARRTKPAHQGHHRRILCAVRPWRDGGLHR